MNIAIHGKNKQYLHFHKHLKNYFTTQKVAGNWLGDMMKTKES